MTIYIQYVNKLKAKQFRLKNMSVGHAFFRAAQLGQRGATHVTVSIIDSYWGCYCR
jgi:hypothetical protein